MAVTSPGSATLPAELRDAAPLPELHSSDNERPVAKLTLGERAFFVGHTGSGKTYLATRLIDGAVPPRLPVVVIDPKGMYETPQGSGRNTWDILGDLPRSWERRIRREKRPSLLRVVIRPDYNVDQRMNETLNRIYERIFAAGRCLIYLDEIQALVYQTRAHPSLSRLVQMGRQKKISVWGSTLRPAAIPRMFISESDHIFCFRLRDADDRDRMSQIIGPWGKTPPGPGEHDFFYMPPGVADLDPILVHQGGDGRAA